MNEIRSLTSELVANTRCTVHGVPDILRIYLQGKQIFFNHTLSFLEIIFASNCYFAWINPKFREKKNKKNCDTNNPMGMRLISATNRINTL